MPATCSRCSNHCPWTSCFINMHIDRVNKTVQKIWAVAFESFLIRIFLCELVTVLLPRKRTIDWLQDLELEQALSPQLRFHEQSFDSFLFKNNTCAFYKNLGSLFVNRNQKVEGHHMEKQHKDMDSWFEEPKNSLVRKLLNYIYPIKKPKTMRT